MTLNKMTLNKYIKDGNIVPFKKRTIDLDKEVQVYRCLNRRDAKWYSIRQAGLVVAHSKALMLTQATFVINKSGQRRAIKTGRRNVHAYVKGKISTRGAMGMLPEENNRLCPVTYSPKSGFELRITEQPVKIEYAAAVCLNQLGCSAAYTTRA